MDRIIGNVIRGKGKGKKLGFPTANVALGKRMEAGIYAGKVICAFGSYKAAVYVPKNAEIAEAHILDYEGDLYGQEITITFGKKMRDDKEFASEGELTDAIGKDVEKIRSGKT